MQSLKEGTCRFGNEPDQVKVNFMEKVQENYLKELLSLECCGDNSGHLPTNKGCGRTAQTSGQSWLFQKRRSPTWTSLTFSIMMSSTWTSRRVGLGRHFARTWLATCPAHRKRGSSTTWQSTPGQKKLSSDTDDWSTGMEANCQLIRLSSPHRRVILRDSSDRRTQARCRFQSIPT